MVPWSIQTHKKTGMWACVSTAAWCICALPLPVEKCHSLILGCDVTSKERSGITFSFNQLLLTSGWKWSQLQFESAAAYLGFWLHEPESNPQTHSLCFCSFWSLKLLCSASSLWLFSPWCAFNFNLTENMDESCNRHYLVLKSQKGIWGTLISAKF